MLALIFGANGQDGVYLREACEARQIQVIGSSRSGHWKRADVSQLIEVEALLQQHRPDYIFHLAANSSTRHDVLLENHATIATGTLNILEAARKHCPEARIFITGSGLQFRNEGRPISENDAFEANSAYSLARIHSTYAARYYRGLGLRVYVGYLFHHESTRRGPHHVSKMIARSVQEIARGEGAPIEIGDLSVKKEWTFAGDVVSAMLTLVEQDQIHEATIGSGIAYSIEDWLEQCFTVVGMNWREHVKIADNYSAEYKLLVSDPTTIHSLGWTPRVGLPELAAMMIAGT